MAKRKLVVLSGAGISAESGIKTFRDSDGLWEGYDVREVATPGAFRKNPALVLEFYNMRRKAALEAKPNAAHFGLAELQEHFDVQIITQNIDNLHEQAGSEKVLHLHGEIFKMRSVADTSRIYDITGDIRLGDLAPDGEQLRPHIVWFEEPVPKIAEAVPLVKEADIFVVVGTSLVVYPAAGLVDFVQPRVPKYVIDKKIPKEEGLGPVTEIEMPATAGVKELKRLLLGG